MKHPLDHSVFTLFLISILIFSCVKDDYFEKEEMRLKDLLTDAPWYYQTISGEFFDACDYISGWSFYENSQVQMNEYDFNPDATDSCEVMSSNNIWELQSLDTLLIFNSACNNCSAQEYKIVKLTESELTIRRGSPTDKTFYFDKIKGE